MCLYIDKNIHPRNKVRIAGYDILVWKQFTVKITEGKRKYLSPFYHMQWIMEKLVTAKLKLRGTQVNEGIHAFVSKPAFSYYKVFPAVIPKGTRFYIGVNEDIVAEALIVYSSLTSLKKKYRVKEKGDLSRHEFASR